MARDNETWVQNIFVKQSGIEAFMPEVKGSLLENGYKNTDLKRVESRTRSLRSMPKAWRAVALQQEMLAREAEENGHRETAGLLYHRAAVYYGKAQLYFHEDSPRKKEMHADVVRCYQKVCQFSDTPIERVILPFGAHKIYGLLHLPPGKGPFPAVLQVPGMDMIKEDKPNPQDNPYLKRGMAVLSIDGPGQGETRVNGLKVTLENYQEAARVFLDYLSGRPEIDRSRIGLLGISMGSYWGPLIAAHDSRVKACVAALGCYLDKHRIFDAAQPGFRRGYMYMSGIHDDKQFDEMARQMTLAKVADRIKVPLLLACGELDELCPPEEVRAFFEMLSCPKEMWLFEDEFHPCGGVAAELYPWAIDWLRDCLLKGCDPAHKKERFFPTRY